MRLRMNWQSIAFDWNQARAFMATAEEGSLSAAARVLNQTQPTLGRQVAALEEALGVALFDRVGRGYALTAPGRAVLEHVKAMADAATQVSLVASGQAQNIEGEILITATDILSAFWLPKFIAQMKEIAPRLAISVVADDSIRDIQRREADIAIRHVRPEQPNLIARLVREEAAHFYASRTYLQRYGVPKKSTLASHSFIHFGEATQVIPYLAAEGIMVRPEQFPYGSKSGLVSWEMARAGLGIMIMSDNIGRAAPDMQRVLVDEFSITFPVWLATHRELHTSRRIRLVYDHLADYLAKELA